MPLELPSERQAPTLSPGTMKALLYGPPKVGKSTFVAEMDPEHTLFLACEPGLGALEVFTVSITSWTEFREIGAELSKDAKQFKTVAIDTVDELYRMCSEHVCKENGVKHPTDLEYGKGWTLVADEWRLRIGKLASLGLGVWFISHAKETEVPARVGKVTKTVPTMAGQARSHVLGFCDFIFLAGFEGEEEDENSRRVLYTQATEQWEVGGRVPRGAKPLPDPLPLDAEALRKAMAETFPASPSSNGQAEKSASRKREAVSA